ncbi:MAG TPA: S1C family serine protease [Bryobacteraceae bacterium]|nr:S1C family serine protease [Bryobacteraceae bacterium]
MENPLSSLSDHLASVVERAGQSVVAIHARPRFDSSGVHWKPGIIVTAEHTIRRDDDIRITAANGVAHTAELVGRDPGTDLAVLRVKDLDVPVAPRAESGAARPGNVVLAVGRMKDSASAAFGVLSSISGPSQTWRGGRLDQVVRLDLSLHPGASGGAVVDASGNLIGIATSALSRVSVFAIPLSTVGRVADKLLAHGRVPRGYLGVGLQPVSIPDHLKSKLNLSSSSGLIAISVDPEAPAGRAGMVIGDILLELSGAPIGDSEDVQEALDSDSIGKTIKARILRGGELTDLDVTVGERPRKA